LEGKFQWILNKEIITVYCNNYMEGVNEDSNIHLQFSLFVTLELIVGEEGKPGNVETPVASESHTDI
jgi:hypothetical protein